MCGYCGIFISVGRPSRWDVRCPACGGRERHRLTHLWVIDGGGDKLIGKRILHFAPEKAVIRQMRGNPLYETADLYQIGVSHQADITRVALPDASYDVVMAHHVLEHIDDDRQAMRELFRLLKPGGFAILSVPINASRRQTYENPAITTPEERFVHFGGEDHKRYYGLDFAERLATVGFNVETFRLPPEQEVTYGLLRDEWLTIAWKLGDPSGGANISTLIGRSSSSTAAMTRLAFWNWRSFPDALAHLFVSRPPTEAPADQLVGVKVTSRINPPTMTTTNLRPSSTFFG